VTWSWCDSPRARAPNMACQSTTVPVPPASHPSGGRQRQGQNAELPQLPSMAAGHDGRSMLNPGRAPPSSVLRCAWNRRGPHCVWQTQRFCRAVIASANHRRPAKCHQRKGPGSEGAEAISNGRQPSQRTEGSQAEDEIEQGATNERTSERRARKRRFARCYPHPVPPITPAPIRLLSSLVPNCTLNFFYCYFASRRFYRASGGRVRWTLQHLAPALVRNAAGSQRSLRRLRTTTPTTRAPGSALLRPTAVLTPNL
jgi:hypothetical protein